MSYANRSADRARILAALADELLAQRKAAPARATQRNQHFSEAEQKPTAQEKAQTDTVSELLRRLAIKDRGPDNEGD